jgi:hypothetical protein
VPNRDSKTGDVLVSELNRDVRERLLETTSQRLDELLREVLTGLSIPKFLLGPLRWLLGLFIKGELNKRLAL